jgi:hypothetical protein
MESLYPWEFDGDDAILARSGIQTVYLFLGIPERYRPPRMHNMLQRDGLGMLPSLELG